MGKIYEKPFTINGINSWIHCLNMDGDKPSEHHTPRYHFHEYVELLYALDGEAFVWVNGKYNKFQAGEMAVINSNEVHAMIFKEKFKYICVKFMPQILCADDNSLYEFKYIIPFVNENTGKRVFSENDLKIPLNTIFKEIINEWENNKVAFEMIIRSDILSIFAALLRFKSLSCESERELHLSQPIKKALAYINENYATVQQREVARIVGLSYGYFSCEFKAQVGKAFNEYLNNIKIRKSEELLITTDMCITEIAMQCGFSSTSHYISKFKVQKGITPLKFRSYRNAAFLKI